MTEELKKNNIETTPLRRALVTGCGGVLGYALVKRLLTDGWHVTGTTRSGLPPLGAENVDQFAIAKVELTHGDSIEKILDIYKPDVVFHLAASNDNSVPDTGPMPILLANILGTLHLLEAIRTRVPQSAVVLTSSIESFYATDCNTSLTPYQCSKLTIEILAKCYRDSYGISCGVIQLSSLYGPGDRSNRRLIPHCIRKLLKSERIDTLSHTDTERDFLYSDDAADALMVALENPDFFSGQLFSVSSGTLVRIGELIKFLYGVADLNMYAIGNISTEVRKSIGPPLLPKWTPKWTLEKGLIATWDWYKRKIDYV